MSHTAPLKPYKPFPPGTVRGPYRNPQTVQFMVQTRNGWVVFARRHSDEKDAEWAATEFSKKHIRKKRKSHGR